ncbi:FAD-binding oxidoreductase [Streptomyces sp. NPDC091281]|uniref:FAD-binding oxidoreductase n=1 Tax=Streptomyces sp. NPDC091281 TaxID=3365985 RepID=UPI0037F7D559
MTEQHSAPRLPAADLDHRAGLADLARAVTGSVYTPGDPGYARGVVGFNLRSAHAPLAVVAAADASDVRLAVEFAAARDIPVGVVSTGHQPFPRQEDFLLITTGSLRSVEIDAGRAVARVGAGARWSDVLAPAQQVGLAPLNGSAPHVGVVGYTLGGGLSPVLGRSHGWAADHLLSVELVTPDGVLRRVSADAEPELFAGLRGGRSNFGVVTELEFRLFPVTSFYGGALYYPAEDVAAVLDAYTEVARDVPDEFTCSVALLNLPPLPEIPEVFRGRFLAHVRIAHTGTDESAEKLIAPFRALGTPLVDTVGRHPFSAYPGVHADPTEAAPYEERSALLTALPREAIVRVLDRVGPESGSPVSVLEIRHLGGALTGRRASEATPALTRAAEFIVWGATVGPPEVVEAGEGDLRGLLTDLEQWTTGGKYQNFTGRDDVAADLFTAAELDRLSDLKRRYDPRNLFRVNNHTIAPEPGLGTAD